MQQVEEMFQPALCRIFIYAVIRNRTVGGGNAIAVYRSTSLASSWRFGSALNTFSKNRIFSVFLFWLYTRRSTSSLSVMHYLYCFNLSKSPTSCEHLVYLLFQLIESFTVATWMLCNTIFGASASILLLRPTSVYCSNSKCTHDFDDDCIASAAE